MIAAKKKKVTTKEKSSWQKKKVYGKRKILAATKNSSWKKKNSSWPNNNNNNNNNNSAPQGKIRILKLSGVLKLNSNQKNYKSECIYNRSFVGFENLKVGRRFEPPKQTSESNGPDSN